MEIKQEPSSAVTGISAGQGISSKTMVMIKTMENAPVISIKQIPGGKNTPKQPTLIIGLKWDPKFKMPPYDTFLQSFFRF